jgi:hypothetical protein
VFATSKSSEISRPLIIRVDVLEGVEDLPMTSLSIFQVVRGLFLQFRSFSEISSFFCYSEGFLKNFAVVFVKLNIEGSGIYNACFLEIKFGLARS